MLRVVECMKGRGIVPSRVAVTGVVSRTLPPWKLKFASRLCPFWILNAVIDRLVVYGKVGREWARELSCGKTVALNVSVELVASL